MNIYIAHSKDYDYEKELYNPIRNNKNLSNCNIILPHEKNYKGNNTRDFYKSIDIFIAEATYKATGLGIELGWAYDDKIPIFILYKKNSKISSSIKVLTNNFYEYENSNELVKIIEKIANKND